MAGFENGFSSDYGNGASASEDGISFGTEVGRAKGEVTFTPSGGYTAEVGLDNGLIGGELGVSGDGDDPFTGAELELFIGRTLEFDTPIGDVEAEGKVNIKASYEKGEVEEDGTRTGPVTF